MNTREKKLIAIGVGGLAMIGLVLYIADCRARHARERDTEARAELDKLWTVCEGNGMPIAAARTPRVPHPTVLFTRYEESHALWEGDPGWVPDSLRETQLVACFDVKEDLVEMCGYKGVATDKTGAIFRIRRTVTGSVREAKTGEVIAERAFEPSEPGPCPDSTTVSTRPEGISIQAQTKIYGEEPRDAMLAFVREHVAAR